MSNSLTRFSVIVPTIGRQTLTDTLLSVDSLFVDEILVIPDGRQAHDAAEQTIRDLRIGPDIALLDPIEESRMNAWGHPQRNRAMLFARSPWLCFLDDDDVFVPGAFPNILLGLDRYVPHIFKMEYGSNSAEAGRTLWEDAELRECNVGTPMFVIPNRQKGWWPSRLAGDWPFIQETCALQGGPVFVDEVIAIVKP